MCDAVHVDGALSTFCGESTNRWLLLNKTVNCDGKIYSSSPKYSYAVRRPYDTLASAIVGVMNLLPAPN